MRPFVLFYSISIFSLTATADFVCVQELDQLLQTRRLRGAHVRVHAAPRNGIYAFSFTGRIRTCLHLHQQNQTSAAGTIFFVFLSVCRHFPSSTSGVPSSTET